MSLEDCIVAALIAGGITVGLIVVAAIVVVLVTGTGGTGAGFAAAVAAVLASWWVPILTSVLFAMGMAFTLCIGGEVGASDPVGDGATIGVGAGVIISSAIITGQFIILRRLRRAGDR
ncbi:hypothetical protein [Pseudonocardia hierapolitana]|uniref:hypothetical protein n=1 Tax=Pseudonocardia hierapolitana TaxID=1128676 RepID=UPI0011BF6001|nr:hypothetical protein [Pseudonocardia hierapolitana]